MYVMWKKQQQKNKNAAHTDCQLYDIWHNVYSSLSVYNSLLCMIYA